MSRSFFAESKDLLLDKWSPLPAEVEEYRSGISPGRLLFFHLSSMQTSPVYDQILLGDCRTLMAALPDSSVDLVITDPPYLVNYRSRDGRTIANDRNSEWLFSSFQEIFRLLKPNSFCVSFYGWSRVELFMQAWRGAGFTPIGHLVWTKPYASKRGFVAAHHEQAYLLAKGNPERPLQILKDVLPWEFSGNRLHPTQKPLIALRPLVKALSRPGDLILDPFVGSGTTAVAAASLGRRYLGMEILPEYWRIAVRRLAAYHSPDNFRYCPR